MSKVDLHIHSTASDGRFSPEEIVRKAVELGLEVIALADHDSVDGIGPALKAARKFPRLRIFPAVEVSTDVPDGEVHVLGYFIDYTSRELAEELARFRSSRERRAQKMVAKLADLGVHIDWRRVQEIAGDGTMARPHVAQAMLEKGYITSIREAFDKYIARDGPAYVEREKLTPVEAVALIVRTNGLPVMAHPFTVPDPEVLISEMEAAGLVGIEAYYNGYTAGEISRLVSLADQHGLIVTGGSDYHGLGEIGEMMMGGVDVPMGSAERLIALAERRALKTAKP
ncbi:MAG TPA: PHP domain-containing protein [Dehalococcoidales bacterium]|nr:PHP domain-containing protein [Dehalococcoidales bacterium]